MRHLLFGNPNTEYIDFRLDGMSREESVITVNAELRAGFLAANLYLVINPAHLAPFIADLAQLDKTLSGLAVLRGEGPENMVEITVEGLRLGHVLCRGTATERGNTVSFRFQTDQTQLGPMVRWFRAALSRYEELSA